MLIQISDIYNASPGELKGVIALINSVLVEREQQREHSQQPGAYISNHSTAKGFTGFVAGGGSTMFDVSPKMHFNAIDIIDAMRTDSPITSGVEHAHEEQS